MTRLALRGLAARKLRTSLTIIAVLLGVTMIAGTFVLTDTIQKAFDDIFNAQTKGADVVVSGREAVETEFSMPRPLDDSLLDEIKDLPDVEQVAGQINDVAAVVGKDGKVVSTGGAPTIAATYMPPPFAPIGFTKGRPPEGENEIALDAATADKEDFKLGDEVTVATSAPKRAFKLVGLATIGQSTGLGGATFVVFDLPTAQKLFDKEGKVDFAFVAGRDGISQSGLQRQIASLLPPTAQVRTAAEEADKAGDDIREGLGFLTTGLLAFAFIAVLVGAFLIFNTFSITVAQRSRELALLRTLGATRRQVLNSVLLEALMIGADRLGRRHPRRARLREGDQRALQGARHRPPHHEPRAREPHDHRLPAGRHARDAGRRARPGAAGHARRPGRGAARGDRADEGALGAPDPVARGRASSCSAPGSSSRAFWPRAATPRRSCSARPAER